MAGNTVARKRPKPRPVIPPTSEGFEPIRLTSEPDAPTPERVTIAFLDDYELTMPREVPPHVALKVMSTARTTGEAIAMMQMLELVLGAEGYKKLSDWESLTVDNLAALFEVVQSVAMGAMENPKSSS